MPSTAAGEALAVEEGGKAVALFALATMPEQVRARAPLGRFLEWHQLKLVGGMLIAAVPCGAGSLAAALLAMPLTQVAAILDNAQEFVQDADRLNQLGLYADIDRCGQVRLPSEVTEADVAAQLARARQSVESASALRHTSAPADRPGYAGALDAAPHLTRH